MRRRYARAITPLTCWRVSARVYRLCPTLKATRGPPGMSDRTLVASWTPYDWRRAHERGSGSDAEVGDWREAIRTKVEEETSPVASLL